MIGVIADSGDQDVVREFFELFKTPWEFYRNGQKYDVVLCTDRDRLDVAASLVLLYAGRKVYFDGLQKNQISHRQTECVLSYKGSRIPIYGETVAFLEKESGILTDEDSEQCVAYLEQSRKQVLVRIGYDLFGEVRMLLTRGQPSRNANMPALELHIAFLRELIMGSGVSLVEIPPVPEGYSFIACLTHDVDHPSVRAHKWDHTVFGFLYRAVFGSLRSFIQGRQSARGLITNWTAALKLPLVHLGFAKDFWSDFADRYLEVEKGVCSTFFVLPFKDRPGKTSRGSAPTYRAARYSARDIDDTLRKLLAAGCEVGVHGIDAWFDSTRGLEEVNEIRNLTKAAEIGVRMHWLFYDQQSPATLEKAGAAYDSTIGYNETVGYRVGTTQVYKPLEAHRLLELPLHVMDTALFYPTHLNLSPLQAEALLGQMADNALQFGGCLTINWHDRSLAPERLWDEYYRALIADLRSRGAWFPTAGQAVSWFRKRRSAAFETDSDKEGTVRVRVATDHVDTLPGLRLRVHKAQKPSRMGVGYGSQNYVDMPCDESLDTRLACGVSR
jgi:hypothetical protein